MGGLVLWWRVNGCVDCFSLEMAASRHGNLVVFRRRVVEELLASISTEQGCQQRLQPPTILTQLDLTRAKWMEDIIHNRRCSLL